MIVATHKCGCPPKEKKPPCSPCCASAKKVKIKTPALADRSEGPCCKKQRLQSTTSLPKIEEQSQCCPIKVDDSTKVESRKIRSDIAEKGLPYNELEAVINNNRVVIRTQKELPREEYDPPCDCNEDSKPPVEEETHDQVQSSGNRTVTLFPRPQSVDSDPEQSGDEVEEVKTIEKEQNPNIFVLRVKKRCKDGNNIDLEFKTPRPWSLQKRLEYCRSIRPPAPMSTMCNDIEILKAETPKRNASRRGKKRKRR